jgi:glutathione S-transferase
MKLYARRTSSNSQKVLWFLEELGVDYEFVDTGGDAGGLDDPDYRGLNPNGRVPTLVDGDLSVWESHSILRYLAATFDPGRYWPQHPAARSHLDRWMDWSQSQFDASFMALFWGYYRTPEPDRDVQANRMHAKRCRSYMRVLDTCLSRHDYVVGDSFSLADVPIGALMYRYVNLDATDELPPNVLNWYGRLADRNPFRTHIMLPFDQLKGRLAP